jgi:hypothetical protein
MGPIEPQLTEVSPASRCRAQRQVLSLRPGQPLLGILDLGTAWMAPSLLSGGHEVLEFLKPTLDDLEFGRLDGRYFCLPWDNEPATVCLNIIGPGIGYILYWESNKRARSSGSKSRCDRFIHRFHLRHADIPIVQHTAVRKPRGASPPSVEMSVPCGRSWHSCRRRPG